MPSSWDTPTYWVLGIIFGAVLAKGLDLAFSAEHRALGIFMAAFGTVGLLLTIPDTRAYFVDSAVYVYREWSAAFPRLSLIVVMAIGAAVFGGIWLLLPNLEPSRLQPGNNRPATLRQLFENDWPDLPAYYSVSILAVAGDARAHDINLAWRLNGDFSARSKFLAFFLDSSISPQDAVEIFASIARDYQQFINATNSNVDIAGKWPTDTSLTHMSEMAFSNRIFIYYANPELSLAQKDSVESLFREKGLSVQFRGDDYRWLHRNEHPPFRPKPLSPGSVLLPRAIGSGLEIKVTKLSP